MSSLLLEHYSKKLDNPTLSVLPHDFLRPQQAPFVIEKNYLVHLPHVAKFTTEESSIIAILATYCTLIYRLTGDDDIVLYTKNYGVLRFTIDPNWTFQQLSDTIKTQISENNELKFNDFDKLSSFIQKNNDLELTPQLFRLSFSANHNDGADILTEFKSNTLDLHVNFNSKDQVLEIVYNALLYSAARISILADQFSHFVAAVKPTSIITKISLISPASASAIPDPTANLGWCDFRGCIHDIFQDNAEKFPERTLVVETPVDSNSTESRVFTYQDINRASNVVAHYLINKGIKKGDVVMIYSSRGVDLMVCVFGVLKAGGTFSVIDPAYPPARQTVYLGVAKPKGLIVIKAAGVLDQLVEDYISEELDVICRIPQVSIQQDGTILGGTLDGEEDVLKKFHSKRDQRTGIICGPDSNPTLSFTSGSEGLPKGVLGRHFSLAYYFDWMSQQFNLSEKDKFTMLSGIAHDPIQRDMFTPVFLGAQLLVPTQDDIGTPGRLATWMSKYGATVTHLTPAMGQLLAAQATTLIPTLHHAFFVGDILTKRDCLRLQTLAENVVIVNMYGTTETQRAVSFFEVKSRAQDPKFLKNLKDVMPAGKGMFNVQLLVVNRNDRTQLCGVGEVGEIYVRAGGLAEGYRGLPELNKQKFINNWFVEEHHWDYLDIDKHEPWRCDWLGPRDRMYRTGDLGRYLPDGNCECCGRADDQVKIRGFRIELGEIDTHISQHPLVRENVTLVRNNRDNEKTLITFIVPRYDKPEELSKFETPVAESVSDDPVLKGLCGYFKLTKDIKEFLKKRLASYSIPSIIVVLDKLPLNPNGKVDKPKLQYPTQKQLDLFNANVSGGIDESQFTENELEILNIWLAVLPNKPASVSPDDSFFDLGGHSILATRMIFALRKNLNVDLPLGTIFKYPTIKAFAEQVFKTQQSIDSNDSFVSKTAVYSEDAKKIASTLLQKSYPSCKPFSLGEKINVFVTGVTGFLGSYILSDLLTRTNANIRVFAHVRAKDKDSGLQRIIKSGTTYGTWKPEFSSRIEIILADLSKPQLGDDAVWNKITAEVDIIIHNGAMVHWIYPYEQLRDANVISTVNLLNMCAKGKPKSFVFVSSTSTLDSPHYINLGEPVKESDDLMGSATGLSGGYGQSKWAAEYITRAAGKRGLRGFVVRPGYVTGCSKNGSCNTDDFLLRFLKGVCQLHYIPDIDNEVNMVPVDHVARIVTAAGLHPDEKEYKVIQVNAHPRITFKHYLNELGKFGYDVSIESYELWKKHLEDSIGEIGESNALYPLLAMCLDDLPHSTIAPPLDDKNASVVLSEDSKWTGVDVSKGKGCTSAQVDIYISFLNKVGFLPRAPRSEALPEVELSKEQIELVASGASARNSSAASK
ncbi:probable L-aminoadipate-semialdehyde dehydrogenase [Saccharomycodes ludwigii]|uniref:Alpha-aminoadipate reductase n=1 Tax=Saccharomycodes ludwigii TaxID=36035 RepID=A0A376B652_9ASCO|nr:probable L-aminoadipate-semialdehyde dehydrogenase [Saccharomycodes ludwigii]